MQLIDQESIYVPVHALLSMSIHLEQTKFSKSPKFDVGSDWDSERVFVNFSSPFPNQPAAKICIKHSIKHKISNFLTCFDLQKYILWFVTMEPPKYSKSSNSVKIFLGLRIFLCYQCHPCKDWFTKFFNWLKCPFYDHF